MGGLLSVASARRMSNPPRRAFRANDGQTVHEDLVLAGWVVAPETSREILDIYGIDMSCAQYDPLEGRWDGCLFSEQVADMLASLSADGDFLYAFEAFPTWAELEWRVRQARGEAERPELEVYMWTEPASPEAIAAFESHTGISLIRRGPPLQQTRDVAPNGANRNDVASDEAQTKDVGAQEGQTKGATADDQQVLNHEQ